jgi:hypothetical protein
LPYEGHHRPPVPFLTAKPDFFPASAWGEYATVFLFSPPDNFCPQLNLRLSDSNNSN